MKNIINSAYVFEERHLLLNVNWKCIIKYRLEVWNGHHSYFLSLFVPK